MAPVCSNMAPLVERSKSTVSRTSSTAVSTLLAFFFSIGPHHFDLPCAEDHRRPDNTICTEPGVKIDVTPFQTDSAGSAEECQKKCASHDRCLSAEFVSSTGDCKLKDQLAFPTVDTDPDTVEVARYCRECFTFDDHCHFCPCTLVPEQWKMKRLGLDGYRYTLSPEARPANEAVEWCNRFHAGHPMVVKSAKDQALLRRLIFDVSNAVTGTKTVFFLGEWHTNEVKKEEA